VVTLLPRAFARLAARSLAAVLLGGVLLGAPEAAQARKKPGRRAAKTPPIAYYLSAYGKKTPTRAVALASCRAEYQRQFARRARVVPMLSDPKQCQTLMITVRGPHTTAQGGEGEFVYKGSDGEWYDEQGEASCFAAGTPVATPEGTRPIETITAGMTVLAYDTSSQRVVPALVERTKKRLNKPVGVLTFSDGASLTVTANHPFYSVTAGTWVTAGELATGEAVLELDGEQVKEATLVSKTHFDQSVDVHDLTIAEQHDFFAAGVLVHNY
jgi:hypothetical protein